MRRVVIVGSGPSGCYLAEALLKTKDCRVDIIDRLPTPFGLVRFGVAPDHQSTKAVTRLLERVLAKPEVTYFGGVELGRDLSLAELRSLYDAVVIATGAPLDRRLDVPGEHLPGVVTAGRFVGWYNHHPDHADVDLAHVESAIVIGNGNVALDVARVLAKSEPEFDGSDLDLDVARTLAQSGVRHIRIVGRRSAAHMKFSEHELWELGELLHARPVLRDPGDLAGVPGTCAETLRAMCARTYASPQVVVEFAFDLTPVAFEGHERLAAVRFAPSRGMGADVVLPAQLAVTCIGYTSQGHGFGVDDGAVRNRDGKIDKGLYVVGWAKRGPSGTIPTNRAEAHALAKTIDAEIRDGGADGTPGLRDLLRRRPGAHVDYAGWQRIDASEIARAHATRIRRKWRSLEDLFAAAAGSDDLA